MTPLSLSLSRGETLWCVGIYDALSARIAELAGFGAVMTGGMSVTASLLALPDLELLSLGENLDVVRRVAGAVSVPVIADIDTGYGNTINVARAVRDFRAAGAQAVIIEDQVSPKRCAACVDETTLIPIEDAVAKILAAAEAAQGAHHDRRAHRRFRPRRGDGEGCRLCPGRSRPDPAGQQDLQPL